MTKLTNETFLQFKTGDIGYQTPSGDFFITDRLKELIKVKGFQVPPAELEGKLLCHPNVSDVAVIGINDKAEHTEVPRAYIVPVNPKKNKKQDADEIVKWLEAEVVSYKRLRGGVRFIEEIPKSASGKILRRVLKEVAKKEEEDGGKAKL
jgi:4-coumarate--CoA ligase